MQGGCLHAASGGAPTADIQVNAVGSSKSHAVSPPAFRTPQATDDEKWIMSAGSTSKGLGCPRLLVDSGPVATVSPWHFGEGTDIEAPREELRMSTPGGDQLKHYGKRVVPLSVGTSHGTASVETHTEVADVARPILSVSRLAAQGFGLFIEPGGKQATLVRGARARVAGATHTIPLEQDGGVYHLHVNGSTGGERTVFCVSPGECAAHRPRRAGARRPRSGGGGARRNRDGRRPGRLRRRLRRLAAIRARGVPRRHHTPRGTTVSGSRARGTRARRAAQLWSMVRVLRGRQGARATTPPSESGPHPHAHRHRRLLLPHHRRRCGVWSEAPLRSRQAFGQCVRQQLRLQGLQRLWRPSRAGSTDSDERGSSSAATTRTQCTTC